MDTRHSRTLAARLIACFATASSLAIATPSAAAERPRIALAMQPATGVADDEAAATHRLILAELTGLGLDVASAAAVGIDCAPDPACVKGARGALPALLVIELVRVGPVLQLAATGAADAGDVTGTAPLDKVDLSADSTAHLLPPPVRAWAEALAKAAADASSADEPGPKPEEPAPVGLGWTAAQSGALFAGAAGGVALVAAVVLFAVSDPVLADPQSTGAAKEEAVTRSVIAVVSAAVGALAIGGGAAWLAIGGDAPEEQS